MKLSQYLETHSLTETAFAELVCADQSTVHRLRSKGQIPGRDLMARIFEATNGEVTANDFFELPPKMEGAAA